MSRIGKKPISVPKGVAVTLTGELITVKGPKGQLEVVRHPSVEVEEASGELVFTPRDGSREARSAHGLMRALTANAVNGVTKGFERKLEINGVGYRAEVKGNQLVLQLGYSHPIEYDLPAGVTAKVEKAVITLSGIDKQLLGQTAANVRGFRPPEPYKGKGIKYAEEQIMRKVGKAAG